MDRRGLLRHTSIPMTASVEHHRLSKELYMSPPNVQNLVALTQDSRAAILDRDPAPADPTNFDSLRGRLAGARDHLPPLYRESFHDPYVVTLNRLGRSDFTEILLS